MGGPPWGRGQRLARSEELSIGPLGTSCCPGPCWMPRARWAAARTASVAMFPAVREFRDTVSTSPRRSVCAPVGRLDLKRLQVPIGRVNHAFMRRASLDVPSSQITSWTDPYACALPQPETSGKTLATGGYGKNPPMGCGQLANQLMPRISSRVSAPSADVTLRDAQVICQEEIECPPEKYSGPFLLCGIPLDRNQRNTIEGWIDKANKQLAAAREPLRTFGVRPGGRAVG
jgi:hypothetical protein